MATGGIEVSKAHEDDCPYLTGSVCSCLGKTTQPNHSDDEPAFEVIAYPAGSRFIGPGDDVVISAEKLRLYVQQEVLKGWRRADLNDPKYMLQFIDDPIEKFNMFIKKWCPDYAHLIDSDDNDGEEIRQMIAALKATGASHD